MNIQERVSALRELMKRESIDAFIFPSTDPHNGEYVPDHWKSREWISGFNGSAGTAVVTLNEAALWTDSRYFIAANEQLQGTGFCLMKDGVEGTPSISEWLGNKLSFSGGTCVGIDGMVMSASETENLIAELRKEGGITVTTNLDPLAEIWNDRPEIPLNPIEIQPLKYAGETAESKLERIRKAIRSQHACGLLVSALDDIAWTLNLRGNDVHCNPVFVSYLLMEEDSTTLFVNDKKLKTEVKSYLNSIKVKVEPYENVRKALKAYKGYNIMLDKSSTCYTLFKDIQVKVEDCASPIPFMKAIKSEAEVAGFREAMKRDGVALVKFLRWLKPAVEKGGETELSIDRKLTSLRAEQALYRDVSFDTISAYQEHGAIVHYEPTAETDIPVRPEGFLLLDSGAQYQDATTDITRTIALGPLTDEQRKVYTLVLKGNIQLAMLKFPDGASGTQLDALARMDMWREGMNYLHGTGHGVGSYLNVHEGPHQIRMQWKSCPLRANMTVTDEPGLYLEGRFGVRIENTMIILPYKETEFGRFLQMEPLTLCPIDTEPIILEMMRPEEIEWLNNYHKRVYDELSPLLENEEDREWLTLQTEEIIK
ncbi:MAG: aminopeptidase P family protein [Prevotellaceae bacterium]|nr:aminopeptidase P family protein [Prevotellaceae bacterium]